VRREFCRCLKMLEKRSFSLSGHRTSVALEPEFWAALEDMAKAQNLKLSALLAKIDQGRQPVRSLASALRLAVLEALQTRRDV